ncbi:MAG: ankyrin repeat domain-containing protein, partial [Deltaproteobacteria bacterium]|nr:ankyrin repeat domain-containing protein [Deltaproteobacteria bacterium]
MFAKYIVAGSCLLLVLVPIGVLGATAAKVSLADAAMKGDRAAVRALLEQQVDVNLAQGDGSTALHWAAYRNDSEMARLLLEAGADIRATTRLGELTPLFMAAK